jgi:ADP-ribosylglycohydrolase
MEIKNRYKGSMLGLAVGDTLGAPVEFKAKDSFEKIEHYRRGGKFNVEIGEYTDDTSLALCLAQSLIDRNGSDQKDQLSKYLKWFEEGYMSANGRSIGCGKVTLRALYRYMSQECSECGNSRLTKGAGNGSLMRIAPVALFYADDMKLAMKMAKESSLTTHGLPICSDACMYMTGLIIGAIEGKSKDELLSVDYAKTLFDYVENYTFHEEVTALAHGDYKNKSRDEIEAKGYVINTLESALWAFYNTSTFDEGLILVVNLGNDADTVGAVYGQLAGAYYGDDTIAIEYKDGLMKREFIEELAEKLLRGSL